MFTAPGENTGARGLRWPLLSQSARSGRSHGRSPPPVHRAPKNRGSPTRCYSGTVFVADPFSGFLRKRPFRRTPSPDPALLRSGPARCGRSSALSATVSDRWPSAVAPTSGSPFRQPQRPERKKGVLPDHRGGCSDSNSEVRPFPRFPSKFPAFEDRFRRTHRSGAQRYLRSASLGERPCRVHGLRQPQTFHFLRYVPHTHGGDTAGESRCCGTPESTPLRVAFRPLRTEPAIHRCITSTLWRQHAISTVPPAFQHRRPRNPQERRQAWACPHSGAKHFQLRPDEISTPQGSPRRGGPLVNPVRPSSLKPSVSASFADDHERRTAVI